MSDPTNDPGPALGQPSGLETAEASVPPAMIEPAQALEEATGLGVTAPAAAAAAVPVFQQNIIIEQRRHGPGLFVRGIWYLLIGWWLTGLAITFAWLCTVSIVLLPIGYLIVSKIPTILTLRPRSIETDVAVDADGTVRITTGGAKQPPFWQRALWFIFVGWWACGVAMFVAYVLCLTVVLIPIGLMIFNRVPAVMTLQRN
jgi:uncharacterized membrane protein YccF (DUF307 family)